MYVSEKELNTFYSINAESQIGNRYNLIDTQVLNQLIGNSGGTIRSYYWLESVQILVRYFIILFAQ